MAAPREDILKNATSTAHYGAISIKEPADAPKLIVLHVSAPAACSCSAKKTGQVLPCPANFGSFGDEGRYQLNL